MTSPALNVPSRVAHAEHSDQCGDNQDAAVQRPRRLLIDLVRQSRGVLFCGLDADAAEILDCLGALKHRKSEPIQTLTPEQLNERYEEKLRSLGPVGLQLIRDAQGGRK